MRCNALSSRPLAIAAFALVLSACNGNSGLTTGAPGVPLSSQPLAQAQTQAPLKRTHHHGSSGKIQHVVIIVQENRSFNNLFYGFPGAKTAKYGYDYHRPEDHAPADRARDDLGHRAQFVRVRRGLQRHGQHSRHELPDERLRQRVRGAAATAATPVSELAIRRTLTCRIPRRSRTLTWASNTSWPTRCTRRTSMRAASSRISTSSRLRPSRRSTIRPERGAAPAAPGDKIAMSVRSGKFRTATSDPVLTTRRSAKKRTRPEFPGRTMPLHTLAAYPRHLERLPGEQIRLLRLRLEQDVISPPSQFLTDVSNGKLRQISWVTPTCDKLRPRRLRLEHRARMGGVARQCDRRIEVLGLHRDLHLLGRLRRLVRSRAARIRGLRRPRHATSHAGRFAVCEEGVRLARPLRARQHPEVRRGSVRLGAALGQRHARQVAGEGLLRLQTAAAEVPSNSDGARQGLLPASAARSIASRHPVRVHL